MKPSSSAAVPYNRLNETRKLTLLPQLRLSFLHRGDEHVADTGIGETVQVGAGAEGLDDEERLSAAIVCAVDHGAGGQTESQTELVAGSACACSDRMSAGATTSAWSSYEPTQCAELACNVYASYTEGAHLVEPFFVVSCGLEGTEIVKVAAGETHGLPVLMSTSPTLHLSLVCRLLQARRYGHYVCHRRGDKDCPVGPGAVTNCGSSTAHTPAQISEFLHSCRSSTFRTSS